MGTPHAFVIFLFVLFVCVVFFVCLFVFGGALFRAALMAYGGSQAR